MYLDVWDSERGFGVSYSETILEKILGCPLLDAKFIITDTTTDMGSKSSKDDQRKRSQTLAVENFQREKQYQKSQSDHKEYQRTLNKKRVVESKEGRTYARSLSGDRFYVIHLPINVDSNKKIPILMMFHGKQE